MDWWIVVIVVSQLAFIAFLIAVAANYRQRTMERRSEERLRVLERFTSGQELADFLATDSGSEFLQLFAVKARSPGRIIIAGTAFSIFAGCLGIAFLLLAWLDAQDLGVEYLVAAVIVLAAAFGILVASAVSLKMAKRLGLLSSDDAVGSEPRQ